MQSVYCQTVQNAKIFSTNPFQVRNLQREKRIKIFKKHDVSSQSHREYFYNRSYETKKTGRNAPHEILPLSGTAATVAVTVGTSDVVNADKHRYHDADGRIPSAGVNVIRQIVALTTRTVATGAAAARTASGKARTRAAPAAAINA